MYMTPCIEYLKDYMSSVAYGPVPNQALNPCSLKAIAHRVWNFHMRFSVFYIPHPFLSKFTDAKTQKIEPDPNFFMTNESLGGSV